MNFDVLPLEQIWIEPGLCFRWHVGECHRCIYLVLMPCFWNDIQYLGQKASLPGWSQPSHLHHPHENGDVKRHQNQHNARLQLAANKAPDPYHLPLLQRGEDDPPFREPTASVEAGFIEPAAGSKSFLCWLLLKSPALNKRFRWQNMSAAPQTSRGEHQSLLGHPPKWSRPFYQFLLTWQLSHGLRSLLLKVCSEKK